jgi:hypothetical protein
MAAAVLTIDINARLAGLEQGLRKVESSVAASGKRIESSVSGINERLAGSGTRSRTRSA